MCSSSLLCNPVFDTSDSWIQALSSRNTAVLYLIVIKQAHLHVADAPIPIQVDAREPVSQTVLISSIFFTEHKVYVVFVCHCGPGIRSVLIPPPLGKRPWTHRHDPEQQRGEHAPRLCVENFSALRTLTPGDSIKHKHLLGQFLRICLGQW